MEKTIIEKQEALKQPTTSLATMMICKDGICCITDSRVINSNHVVTDEAYKSTVIKNVNGLNLLVGIVGASQIGNGEIVTQLNRRFNNSSVNVEYYTPRAGISSLLYAIALYVQMYKEDDEPTTLIFGFYQGEVPQLVVCNLDRTHIDISLVSGNYAICGEPCAVDDLTKNIKDMTNVSMVYFAHHCIDTMHEIMDNNRDNKNYGVGGFVNVIAIDSKHIKNIDFD